MSTPSANIRRTMWYKHKIKWQKTHIPPVLRIALDLRYMIYDHIFEESKMVDITITERGSTKRRHGSQSILLVNKQIRNEALKIFYQKCTFEIPHFKLHEQHRRENPMTGLKHIFKLDVLWTPPPERAFTTTAGDDRLLLSLLELRQLTINVLSLQYIRLKANLTPVKFQEEVIKKLEKIMPSFPRWITRALDACPRRPGLKLFLVVYVAVGNEREVLKQDLTTATISWPSKSIVSFDTVGGTDWQAARARLIKKQVREPLEGGKRFGRKRW